MILYHVTLFNKPTQEILIPRIPGDTSIGEEVKTNRICLAPSIIQCLRALEIYKYFQEDTLDVKVYKIVVDENDEQLISWEQLYLNGLVDDAALTHEYWYKSKLIPAEYNEYRISECVKKRYIIIPYGEILEEEAFVSEQRAYCQGYVDCIQLLAGLGLLKKSTDMEKIISEMKSN